RKIYTITLNILPNNFVMFISCLLFPYSLHFSYLSLLSSFFPSSVKLIQICQHHGCDQENNRNRRRESPVINIGSLLVDQCCHNYDFSASQHNRNYKGCCVQGKA